MIYGSQSGFKAKLRTTVLDGSNGYKIYGTTEDDEFGFSLAAVGDVNGDDIDDFVVGCPSCRPTGGHFYAGAAFVFYGTADPMSSSSVEATAANVVVAATDTFDGLGGDVSFAGDVNGDGINDIMIGSARGMYEKDAILYILYGSTSDLKPSIAANEVDGSLDGRVIPMLPSDFAGMNSKRMSVAFAGDLNNDGITDLLVGLPDVKLVDNTSEGQVRVILGDKIGSNEY